MKIPKTFAERLKTPEHTPGHICAENNWVGFDRCSRTTNWSCGECGRPVCATHAHNHARPDGARFGRLVCERTYCQINIFHPDHPALRR